MERRTGDLSAARSREKASANCASSKPGGPTARDNMAGRVAHRHDQPVSAAQTHMAATAIAHRQNRVMPSSLYYRHDNRVSVARLAASSTSGQLHNDMDHARLALRGNLQPTLIKHLQHGGILRQDFGD